LLHLALDVGAGAETGIQQVASGQRIQRRAIRRQVLRLHTNVAIPVEAQPCQVLQDGGSEFGAAAARVDVLQPQQEAATRLARAAPGEQRTERVAEMQVTGRAGGEAGDDGHADGQFTALAGGAVNRPTPVVLYPSRYPLPQGEAEDLLLTPRPAKCGLAVPARPPCAGAAAAP
jgi:hypothetical protein